MNADLPSCLGELFRLPRAPELSRFKPPDLMCDVKAAPELSRSKAPILSPEGPLLPIPRFVEASCPSSRVVLDCNSFFTMKF